VTDVHTDPNVEAKERKAERHSRILIAAISAGSGVLVALITVFGTIAATDREIVPQGTTAGPTVERTVTVAPTATETVTIDPSGEPLPTDQPTADETALDTNWNTTADEYFRETGKVVVFDCPSAGIPQDIWGGPYYSYDSSVCTAAVHNGRITLKKGGRVTIQIREGLKEYKASRSNGITSQEWPESGTRQECSFEFLPRR
jgi:LCCL domain